MRILKMIGLLWILMLFLGCGMNQPTPTKADSIDIQKEIDALKDTSYLAFLQANLGSMHTESIKEACAKGSKPACNEPSFIFDRNVSELQELCAREIQNACYQLGQRQVDLPLKENSTPKNITTAQPKETLMYMQKACTLGHTEACGVAGVLLETYFNDSAHAFALLKQSCQNHSMLACQGLYTFLKQDSFKNLIDPTEYQNLLHQTSMKILDFGLENLLCEGVSCLGGQFIDTQDIHKTCQSGSALACVSLVNLSKRENREKFIHDGAFQEMLLALIEPHCFGRGYVPACQGAMELYELQKRGDKLLQAGTIACKSNFYAQGLLRFKREYQICTRTAESYATGQYGEGKQAISTPIDQKKALYLYKIGCERGNEMRACVNLERALKEQSF